MSYSDTILNKNNDNITNQGITDTHIRDKRLGYVYNGLSKDDPSLQHNYSISLACESGTDIVHAVGNVTAIAMQFILDLFPSKTFNTALPSTTIATIGPEVM